MYRLTWVLGMAALLAVSPRDGVVNAQCLGDFNADGTVAINEIITSVNNSLAGCPPPGVRFVDNADGTITDNQTGLMWEKKDDGGGLHDKDDTYTWADAMGEFISQVNGYSDSGRAQTGLGGHSDWRMPTSAELQTILLEPFVCVTVPCIDSTFGPTVDGFYWSSTTNPFNPTSAWFVGFFEGLVFGDEKTGTYYVRAVRGGS